MKRFIYIFLCVAILCTALPRGIFADPAATDVLNSSEPASAEPVPDQPVIEDAFADVTTPYLLLMEAETGTVVYERAAYEKAYPASTTKLMTAILAIENIADLDRVVTVGWRAVSGFGSTSSLMGLIAYEEIAIIDVVYGLMMRSGNDAAKCLAIETVAEVYGDSVPEENAISTFVEMMNSKAKEIGMDSTNFATVDGRHDDNHYTTAYDFGLLMQYVLKNPKVCDIISTVEHDIEPNNKHPQGYHLENSNKLICKKKTDKSSFLYPYCIGGKTGETNQAGYCLASASEKDGIKLILIQFGDNNTTISTTYRYEVAKKLYDWGFENYKSMPLTEFDLQTSFTIQTSGYSPFDEQLGKLTATANITDVSVSGALEYLDALKANPESIRTEVRAENAKAPIKAGDIIGTIDYYFYEKSAITVNLIADRDIAAASNEEAEPGESVQSSSTPPPGSGKNSNLNLGRNPGGNEYSVWVYYDGSLYTMSNTEWHYLYCADGVFRAASAPENAGSIQLYKQYFDSNGKPYYLLVKNVGNGGRYLIVSNGFALSSDKTDRTMSAVEVNIVDGDTITNGVTDELIWNFENESNGFRISQSSRFLTRKPGSGVIFWIIIVVIVLVIVIIVRSINTRRGFRKHSRRRKSQQLYRKRRYR